MYATATRFALAVLVLELFDEAGRNGQSVAAAQFRDLVDAAEGRTHDNGAVPVFLVVVVDFRHADNAGILGGRESLERGILFEFLYLVKIHDAAYKRRDERGTGLGTGNGLRQGENKGQVAGDALLFQYLGGPDSLPGGGDLDEDAGFVDPLFLVELDELAGLCDGRSGIERETGVDLGGDISGDDLGDFDSKIDGDLVLFLVCLVIVLVRAFIYYIID